MNTERKAEIRKYLEPPDLIWPVHQYLLEAMNEIDALEAQMNGLIVDNNRWKQEYDALEAKVAQEKQMRHAALKACDSYLQKVKDLEAELKDLTYCAHCGEQLRESPKEADK